jgi:RHS repeat-associated protein
MTGYLYDAGGTRVAKGTIGNMSSCDPAANGFQQATEHDYILGPGGEQMTEMYTPPNSTLTTAHANVWVGGILATYDLVNGGLHFALTDPLGTKRVQVSGTGVAELNCLSLPFGNSPGNPLATGCAPVGASTASDATEHHFTGKERDTESGNDYFDARYYSSSMGRFMSPDWSSKPEAVPYSDLENPQTLNLYAYAGNNPLSNTDDDGHCWGSLVQGVCNLWQRINNLAGGLGWHTDAQVDAIIAADRKVFRDAGMDPNLLEKLSYKQIYQIGQALVDGKDSVTVDKVTFVLSVVSQFKIPVPGISGKEGAKDAPSWAKQSGAKPKVGESGKQFAKRLLDEKYGSGNWKPGPGSEFNQIQKWADRSFMDPK